MCSGSIVGIPSTCVPHDVLAAGFPAEDSSSACECSEWIDLIEPKMLEGRAPLESARALSAGEGMLCWLASESARFKGNWELVVDEGDGMSELGRSFFFSTLGRVDSEGGSEESRMGDRPESDGLKMLRLFRLRRSPMMAGVVRCLGDYGGGSIGKTYSQIAKPASGSESSSYRLSHAINVWSI